MSETRTVTSIHAASPIRRSRRSARRCDTRSRRLSIAEIVAMLVIVVLLMAGPVLSRTVSPSDVPTTVVSVGQGDNLWTIAAAHPVNGLTTAQTADLIVRLNNLESVTIAAGRTLEVPSDTDSATVASR